MKHTPALEMVRCNTLLAARTLLAVLAQDDLRAQARSVPRRGS